MVVIECFEEILQFDTSLFIHTDNVIHRTVCDSQIVAACICHSQCNLLIQVLRQDICNLYVVHTVFSNRRVGIAVCGKSTSGHITGEIVTHRNPIPINKTCTVETQTANLICDSQILCCFRYIRCSRTSNPIIGKILAS